MIELKGLTKVINGKTIVEDISFGAGKGEILGFVGPNGAGKTTTLRMLSCCTHPTSGTATVAGYDIQENPMDVKRRIGYLPEVPPLYSVMTVSYYLRLIARMKGVNKKELAGEVDRCIELCRLQDVAAKQIGKLSKGYRQRTGFAQAILGKPEVLLLDEPTSGLDPSQISEAREIIRDFGKEHTVVFSTHILHEIRLLCQKVAIINKGRIIAADSLDNLGKKILDSRILQLRVGGPVKKVEGLLAGKKGVRSIAVNGDKDEKQIDGVHDFEVQIAPDDSVQNTIVRDLVSTDVDVLSVGNKELDIEDVVLKILKG